MPSRRTLATTLPYIDGTLRLFGAAPTYLLNLRTTSRAVTVDRRRWLRIRQRRPSSRDIQRRRRSFRCRLLDCEDNGGAHMDTGVIKARLYPDYGGSPLWLPLLVRLDWD